MRTNWKRVTTRKELRQLIQYCQEERVASIDFETNAEPVHSPHFRPTVMGVSFRTGSGWVIDLAHKESIFKDNWEQILKIFSIAVVENPSITKYVFNGLFEYRIFLRYGYRPRGRFFDVMLMKYLLHEERPNDLKSIVDMLLPEFSGYDLEGKPGKKAKHPAKVKFWSNVPIAELSKYCAGDCDFTLRLGIHFESQLMKNGLYQLFRNFYMPLVRLLSVTILDGVHVNREYLAGQMVSFKKKIDKAETLLYDMEVIQDFNEDQIDVRTEEYIEDLEDEIDSGGLTDRQVDLREIKISRVEAGDPVTKAENKIFEKLNFASVPQMIQLLFESDAGFEFPILARTKTKNPSTNEEVLLKLQHRDDTGFIKGLLELRGLQKLYSTYIRGIYEEHLTVEDKVHPGYLLHGTVCVGENTRLLGREKKIRIGDIIPREKGEIDISDQNLYTLTHTGKYQHILIAVNKGYQPMIEIEDEWGERLQCLPGHLLMTEFSWQRVDDILRNNWTVASFQKDITIDTPKTIKPSREIIKPINKWAGYFVSNWGRVFSDKKPGTRGERDGIKREMSYRIVKGYRRVGFRNNTGIKKNFKVSILVFTMFHQSVPSGFYVDHENCIKTDDYSTNLRLITGSENVKRAYKYSYRSYTYGEKNGESKFSISDILQIRHMYLGGKSQVEIAKLYGSSQGHIGGIVREERWAWIWGTKITQVRDLGMQLVCDVHVEEDESYITDSGFINHNTGRFSSRGPNFQNIPRATTSAYIKKMFISPEDHFFVEMDLSQAELRYAAEVSGDKAMLDVFDQGRNFHVATAALMFDIDYDLCNKARKDETHPQHLDMVKKHKSAKVLNFTIFYGAGAKKVSEFLSERTGNYHSPAEAQEFIDRWFEAFPRAKSWMNKERKKAIRDGFVTNLFNRKRRLPILLNPSNKNREMGKWNEALRQSINSQIQAGSSDITQWINLKVYQAILEGKLPSYIRLVSTVHDSVEYYVHKKDINKVLPIMLNIARTLPGMEEGLGARLKRVPMKASAEYGLNWGTMYSYTPEKDKDKDFSKVYEEEYNKLYLSEE